MKEPASEMAKKKTATAARRRRAIELKAMLEDASKNTIASHTDNVLIKAARGTVEAAQALYKSEDAFHKI